jgi:ribosomal-protein-alanine N-acetyltransferase
MHPLLLPPYSSFPELANEKVRLRPIVPADIPVLLPISFYNARPAASIEEARLMQQTIDQDYAQGSSIHWGISDQQNGHVAGTCGYYRGFKNATGELGCVLLEHCYGQGYITSAMQLAIGFGFRQIGLQRIIAFTSPENAKAIRLLERLQFTRFAQQSEGEIAFELLPDNKQLTTRP